MSKDKQIEVSEGLLGQKYAYATASLLLGVASFIHFLGMEKAILAVVFGFLALRAPATPLRRGWAVAGIVLGCTMIVAVVVAAIVYQEKLAQLIAYLKQFG